jgi:hypothetical protein
LKTRVGSCGEKIIEGRQGQIYEYDDDTLGVMFAPASKTDPFGRWCPKIWNRLRNLGKALGMDCRQDGDSEGCLLFDGNNRAQVKLALQIAKVRTKRVLSPEQRARLATFGFKGTDTQKTATSCA